MSKLIFTLSVMLWAIGVQAQSADLYYQLKTVIEQTHPEINLNNKLLAVNFWSIDDQESRVANKDFEKAYVAYQGAKLKGGLKGLVVVTLSEDDLSSTATITLNKDGVIKSIPLSSEKLKGQADLDGIKNLVFDSNGDQVYKNLPAANVFNSIHKLITR